MKDIFNKPAKPLDLSEADDQVYSPYTLDLTKPAQKPAPKQTNFYEYMPAVMQGIPAAEQADDRPHADDEFGEKLQYWFDTARAKVKGWYGLVTAQVAGAIKPLRLYWAVVIGVGLILGLMIISYIATHRNWITSFPTGTSTSPAGSVQGDKSHAPAASPGKGSAAGGVQSATPAVGGAGATGPGAAAGSGAGTALPVVGAPAGGGSTSSSTYSAPLTAPVSGGSGGGLVQPAPVAAPVPAAPAPVTAPLPVSVPLSTPSLQQPVGTVKSLL